MGAWGLGKATYSQAKLPTVRQAKDRCQAKLPIVRQSYLLSGKQGTVVRRLTGCKCLLKAFKPRQPQELRIWGPPALHDKALLCVDQMIICAGSSSAINCPAAPSQVPDTMQIWIVLLNGKLMELKAERTDTVEVTLRKILARIYTHAVLPLGNQDKFRLVAKVGTTCERMMKGNHKLQSYNTHDGDSFTLVYLANATGEIAPSWLALPEDETEHETRRSRSRSPVRVGVPWRFLFV